MSVKVKNVMEDIVFARMESIIEKSGCCQCDQCKSDVAAYTLSNIKPKYVSTVSGELFSKSVSNGISVYQVLPLFDNHLSSQTSYAYMIPLHPGVYLYQVRD